MPDSKQISFFKCVWKTIIIIKKLEKIKKNT